MTCPKILFQDNHILIINKPSGLVVNRAKTVKGQTLQDWVEENIPVIANFSSRQNKKQRRLKSANTNVIANFSSRSGIVHRLDKDTSGVLIIAKTPQAFTNLQKQFKKRTVKKQYLALTHGRLQPKNGNINMPLARKPSNKTKFQVRLHGRRSITFYQVKKYFPKYTYLKIQPKTGRTHQIRVHLKHIGHPIVSDPIYLGKKRLQKDKTWCPRLFLHAHKINFTHPANKNRVEYKAVLPKDLKNALKSLKK